jgi:site-specific recombinase XerD
MGRISRPLLIKKKNKEKSLFLDHRGKRIDLRLFGDIIEKYWLLSGLERKITAKSFRHSFGAHILDRGAETHIVQALMGHKHLVSTERYGRISVGRLKKVLEKYHPRSSEQAERNGQPRKNEVNSLRSASLIRY